MPILTRAQGDGSSYIPIYTNSTTKDQAINVLINNHNQAVAGSYSLYLLDAAVAISTSQPSQLYALDPVNSTLPNGGQVNHTNIIVPANACLVFYGSGSSICICGDYLTM